jgi:hypothetical protein
MSERRRFVLLLSLLGFALTYLLWNVISAGIAYDAVTGIRITNGQDFLNYWAGPRIAAHAIPTLFDGAAYEAALHRLYPHEFAQLRWSYPLHTLFFLAPFSALPYLPALALWSCAGLGFYLASMWFALPVAARRAGVALVLIAPITLVELLTRQNGFFIGGAALFALILLDRGRPILAGILLGCLTIKPQLFLLWPILLLATGAWRTIAAACITTALLIGASITVHGVAAWQRFLDVVVPFQLHLVSAEAFEGKRMLYQLMMPSITPALRLLGAPDMLTHAAQLAAGIAIAAATFWALRRGRLALPQRALLLASGGLLVTPYSFNYDLTFLTAALMLVWFTRPAASFYTTLLMALAYLLPLLTYLFNLVPAPLSPLILLLVFCSVLHEASANSALQTKGSP